MLSTYTSGHDCHPDASPGVEHVTPILGPDGKLFTSKRSSDDRINATEMSANYKLPDGDTRTLRKTCAEYRRCNKHLKFFRQVAQNLELPDYGSLFDVKVGRNGGTWVHIAVALHMACWLNVEYEAWAYVWFGKQVPAAIKIVSGKEKQHKQELQSVEERRKADIKELRDEVKQQQQIMEERQKADIEELRDEVKQQQEDNDRSTRWSAFLLERWTADNNALGAEIERLTVDNNLSRAEIERLTADNNASGAEIERLKGMIVALV